VQSFTQDFPRIFPRVDAVVNFRGANTSTEINKRIQAKINEYPHRISPGWIDFLKTLIPWFGVATIDAARANPHGEVAQTLRHGRKAAKMIMEEQARQYLDYRRKKAKKKKYRRKK